MCRDIKLENVFVNSDGGVKLGDYKVPIVYCAPCSRLRNEWNAGTSSWKTFLLAVMGA